jgi:hypothetical protein
MTRKQKILGVLQSFAFIPLLATSFTFNPNNLNIIPDETAKAISSSLDLLVNNQIFNEEGLIEDRAQSIDSYFKRRGLPLAGFGRKMVEEAIKNDIDWRMVPAIAMRESTGGKFACKKVKYNPFGWGGCTIGFDSFDQAIETVSRNLGGNNHKTAMYYDGELAEMLENYNGGVVPEYPTEVMAIMKKISPEA